MAMNPHSLRPSELARILNSSELGEVVSRDRIYRHRDKAGLRIGDVERIEPRSEKLVFNPVALWTAHINPPPNQSIQ